MAIDSVKGPENEYIKKISAVYHDVSDITIKKEVFEKQKRITYRREFDQFKEDEEDHFYLKDLEEWGIINLYKHEFEHSTIINVIVNKRKSAISQFPKEHSPKRKCRI